MFDLVKLAVKRVAGRFTASVSGPYATGILVETSYGSFLIDVADFTIGRRLRLSGEYGIDELERIKGHVNPDSRVLVVGAHVGTIAIPLAGHVANVVAIEAIPSTHRLLRDNVMINGVDNVRTLQLAASDKAETLQFLCGKANSGHNRRMPAVLSREDSVDRYDTIDVHAERLDDVFPDDRFDVIFMDIEGSETFALRGMQRLLGHASTLFVEFVPRHVRDIAGATVDDFLEPIAPHFTTMFAPNHGLSAERSDFNGILQALYQANQFEDGLVFTR